MFSKPEHDLSAAPKQHFIFVNHDNPHIGEDTPFRVAERRVANVSFLARAEVCSCLPVEQVGCATAFQAHNDVRVLRR